MKNVRGFTGACLAAVVVACLAVGSYDICGEKPVVASEPDFNLTALNRYRAERRLYPLEHSERLYREALSTAFENARAGRLKHAPIRNGGEVIAFNFSGFREAVQQWHESRAGHHEQINARRFRRCGCACVRFRDRFYCCVRFE